MEMAEDDEIQRGDVLGLDRRERRSRAIAELPRIDEYLAAIGQSDEMAISDIIFRRYHEHGPARGFTLAAVAWYGRARAQSHGHQQR